VLVRNTSEVKAWLKQYQDDMVTEEGYWRPHPSIKIHHLNDQGLGASKYKPGRYPLIPHGVAVHYCYQIPPTGGAEKKKWTESTLNTSVKHATHSVFSHLVSEWRLHIALVETSLAGDSQKSQRRPCMVNRCKAACSSQ
jgi:hypothetical protein